VKKGTTRDLKEISHFTEFFVKQVTEECGKTGELWKKKTLIGCKGMVKVSLRGSRVFLPPRIRPEIRTRVS